MPRSSPTLNAKTELRRFWLSCGLAADAWPRALQSFEQYHDLILAHNEAAGLMGQGISPADFYLKHVADSLAVLLAWPGLFVGRIRLADVGCGAGLPGIVLAVALPQLRLAAIESNHRKADFVKITAAELGLAGRVEVLNRRSRELGYDERYRGRFDVVTARAVAPAAIIIRDCRLLIAPACREAGSRTGGSAILYKTPAAVAAEEPLARREADKHKLTLETSEVISLPADAGTRQLIRVLLPSE